MSNVEIVWTHPGDGLTWITIPSDNVYVPAELTSEELTSEDFSTKDHNVPGVTCDMQIFATAQEEAHIVKATHRRATIEEIAARDVKQICNNYGYDVVEYHIVDRERTMSMDNYWRNAWVHEKGVVDVHFEKAVEVHKQRLREARAYKLADIDLKRLKLIAQGNFAAAKALDEGRLQELLDVTKHPEIEAAQTLDELKVAGVSVISKGV